MRHQTATHFALTKIALDGRKQFNKEAAGPLLAAIPAVSGLIARGVGRGAIRRLGGMASGLGKRLSRWGTPNLSRTNTPFLPAAAPSAIRSVPTRPAAGLRERLGRSLQDQGQRASRFVQDQTKAMAGPAGALRESSPRTYKALQMGRNVGRGLTDVKGMAAFGAGSTAAGHYFGGATQKARADGALEAINQIPEMGFGQRFGMLVNPQGARDRALAQMPVSALRHFYSQGQLSEDDIRRLMALRNR